MKKQVILALGGVVLLFFLFFFGKTVEKTPQTQAEISNRGVAIFDIHAAIQMATHNLTAQQQAFVSNLQDEVSKSDTSHQIKYLESLEQFWKDTVGNIPTYEFYLSQESKLVNSEKSLTFAAQFILDDLRSEQDMSLRSWKGGLAIELFEQAIGLNPTNDSLKVALSACYIFGKGIPGDAAETMKGVMILKDIVQKDSANMQAQFVLGAGDVISGQYNKGINRLLLVVQNDPANIEAISWLGDAYAGNGDKANAIKWYEISKRTINNPQYSRQVDERIKMLR